MHILIITQLFQPEPNHLKGLIYAKELVRRGHTVDILTGFPNYPGGRLYPGYKIRLWMRETIEGIPVTRIIMFPSHDRSAIRRMACYLSFAISAAKLGPFLVRKPDIIHVYQGATTLAWPAIVLKIIFRVPYILDVQDIWPESVSSSGMLPIPGVVTIIGLWSKLTYHLAQTIVVLSKGYRDLLIRRGVPLSKIRVIQNWCDEKSILESDHVDTEDSFDLRGRFNVVYTGNFGRVQALETVLDAAILVYNRFPDIRFVLVGDGVDALHLKAIAAKLELKNVLFIPRQSAMRLRLLTAVADVLLIHLKDDVLTRIAIPQKTQAALAARKPIIMAVRGCAANLVCEAGAGIICNPENPEKLAEAVVKMFKMPCEERESMGLRGSKFYRERLAFSVGIDQWMKIFNEATR